MDAIDEDEEDEDDEFGVRDTVKQFHPGEPSKEERERSKRGRTCRLATGAGTASECEASRKREEKPRETTRWRRCTVHWR